MPFGTNDLDPLAGEPATDLTGGIPPPKIFGENDLDPLRPEFQQDDPNSPIQKFMAGGGIVSPGGAASATEQAVGSLPTEPEARIQYYAQRRFPNLQMNEAMKRYGMSGGRIFYIEDDGAAHYEESEMRLPTEMGDIPEALAETGKAAMGSAGPALPVVAGTAAGVATYPFIGGVPGATAGGAAGDVARQGLAHVLTGEEKPFIDRLMQTGGAAAQEGAGQVFGLGMAKGLSRMGRTPVYDVPASTRAGKIAKQFDIPLTAGEQTGSKTLIRRQKILGSTTEGEEIFEGFYRMRNEKVRAAVYKVLKALSPEESVRGASAVGVEGAQAAKGVERKALQRKAKPLYEEAEKVTDVDTRPVLDLLDEKIAITAPPVAAKMRRVKNSLRVKNPDYVKGKEGIEEFLPEGSLAKIDEIKKWLDDEIAKAGRGDSSIGKAQKRHLEDVRKLLVGQADEASEAYARARGIYEAGMPSAAKVEKGIVGDVAKLEQNDVLRATRMLFSPRTSSRHDVRIARLAFNKAGKQAEWDALVRAHIQDTLESIPEGSFGNVTNLGGTLFKRLVGSPKQGGMLKEALKNNPGTMQDVMWLMEALQATGKAAKGESITAFAQAGQRELARESKPALASALETIEVWRTPSRVSQYWANISEGRYARRMSEILTSPDGIAKLRELRKLSPKSAAAVIGISHLLLASGTAAAEDYLSPQNVKPGGFGATTQNQPPP